MLPGRWGTTTSYVMNHAARTATTRQSIARGGRAANGGGKERRGGERERQVETVIGAQTGRGDM